MMAKTKFTTPTNNKEKKKFENIEELPDDFARYIGRINPLAELELIQAEKYVTELIQKREKAERTRDDSWTFLASRGVRFPNGVDLDDAVHKMHICISAVVYSAANFNRKVKKFFRSVKIIQRFIRDQQSRKAHTFSLLFDNWCDKEKVARQNIKVRIQRWKNANAFQAASVTNPTMWKDFIQCRVSASLKMLAISAVWNERKRTWSNEWSSYLKLRQRLKHLRRKEWQLIKENDGKISTEVDRIRMQCLAIEAVPKPRFVVKPTTVPLLELMYKALEIEEKELLATGKNFYGPTTSGEPVPSKEAGADLSHRVTFGPDSFRRSYEHNLHLIRAVVRAFHHAFRYHVRSPVAMMCHPERTEEKEVEILRRRAAKEKEDDIMSNLIKLLDTKEGHGSSGAFYRMSDDDPIDEVIPSFTMHEKFRPSVVNEVVPLPAFLSRPRSATPDPSATRSRRMKRLAIRPASAGQAFQKEGVTLHQQRTTLKCVTPSDHDVNLLIEVGKPKHHVFRVNDAKEDFETVLSTSPSSPTYCAPGSGLCTKAMGKVSSPLTNRRVILGGSQMKRIAQSESRKTEAQIKSSMQLLERWGKRREPTPTETNAVTILEDVHSKCIGLISEGFQVSKVEAKRMVDEARTISNIKEKYFRKNSTFPVSESVTR